VVISSHWQQHALTEEQDQAVTLAAHSISEGRQSSALHGDSCEEGADGVAQFWQAEDVIGRRRQTFQFRWLNLITAIPLHVYARKRYITNLNFGLCRKYLFLSMLDFRWTGRQTGNRNGPKLANDHLFLPVVSAALHIFVMSKHRDFLFGLQVDYS